MGYLIRALLLGLLVYLGYRKLVRWLGGGRRRPLEEGESGAAKPPTDKSEGRPMTDQPIEEADYEELP
jgi:hypothetical protein